VAEAEAEALRLQREVISPELLQLRFIEKWDGVLPMFSSGDSGLTPLITIPEEQIVAGSERRPTPTPTPLPADEPETTPTPTPEQ
jgi:hypothetical protein